MQGGVDAADFIIQLDKRLQVPTGVEFPYNLSATKKNKNKEGSELSYVYVQYKFWKEKQENEDENVPAVKLHIEKNNEGGSSQAKVGSKIKKFPTIKLEDFLDIFSNNRYAFLYYVYLQHYTPVPPSLFYLKTPNEKRKTKKGDDENYNNPKRRKIAIATTEANKDNNEPFKVRKQPIVTEVSLKEYKRCITGIDYAYSNQNRTHDGESHETGYSRINTQTDNHWITGKQSPMMPNVSKISISIPSDKSSITDELIFPCTIACITHDDENSLPIKLINIEYIPVSLVNEPLLVNRPFVIVQDENNFVANFQNKAIIHIYVDDDKVWPVMTINKTFMQNGKDNEKFVVVNGDGKSNNTKILYTLILKTNHELDNKWSSTLWTKDSHVFTVHEAKYRMKLNDEAENNSSLNTTGNQIGNELAPTSGDIEMVFTDSAIPFKHILLNSTPYYTHYLYSGKGKEMNFDEVIVFSYVSVEMTISTGRHKINKKWNNTILAATEKKAKY